MQHQNFAVMKRSDLFLILFILLLFVPFFLSDNLYNLYNGLNRDHGIIMSFIKFGILATLGEVIGLRIKTGQYNAPGFGIIPRAIVWGFLGITIKLAFIVFTSGTLDFLTYMGMDNPAGVYKADFTLQKLFIAFCISFMMNTIFAPIMMTTHKVTDTHILNTGGTVKGLFFQYQCWSDIEVFELGRSMELCIQKDNSSFLVSGTYNHFPIACRISGTLCCIVGDCLGAYTGNCLTQRSLIQFETFFTVEAACLRLIV